MQNTLGYKNILGLVGSTPQKRPSYWKEMLGGLEEHLASWTKRMRGTKGLGGSTPRIGLTYSGGMTEDCDGDNRFDRVRTLYQRGSTNVTVVPDPNVLTALTDPRIHKVACFAIARPSPTPPWARLWPGSTR